ncbi:MAG TPA: hypothetical protein VK054_07385, partial [Beutenbergiaceae bacterium]|nr:hypothetical protein [Beutenbergiaceae bacterium]
ELLPVLTTVSGRRICPYTHTQSRNKLWRRGTAPERVMLVTQRNGVTVRKLQCIACKHVSSALPNALVNKWDLPEPSAARDNRDTLEPCCVVGCGLPETEQHHFAPRNIFGAEADNWPVLPLCRNHHAEWHDRMDGYQRTKKGTW